MWLKFNGKDLYIKINDSKGIAGVRKLSNLPLVSWNHLVEVRNNLYVNGKLLNNKKLNKINKLIKEK